MIENNITTAIFGSYNNLKKEEFGILVTFFAHPVYLRSQKKRWENTIVPLNNNIATEGYSAGRKSFSCKVTTDLPRATYDSVSKL